MYKANATITHTQTSSIPVGENPITGEPIFETSSTSESIMVSLEKDTVENSIGVQPGKDIVENFYTGRLVEPTNLPSWYKPGATYDLTWDDGKTGKFYVYPTMRSRFGLEAVFGEQIEGVILT